MRIFWDYFETNFEKNIFARKFYINLKEQMNSITRMLDEVQVQFEKESTLRRNKKCRSNTVDCYLEDNKRQSFRHQHQHSFDGHLHSDGIISDL